MRSDPGVDPTNIVNVTAINTGENEYSARLSPDELSIYVTSDAVGGIGVAKRSTEDQEFGTPVALAELNTPGAFEGHFSIADDDLTAYFVSSMAAGGPGGVDIVTTTRATSTSVFATRTAVGAINGTSSEFNAYVVFDGSAIYLASDRGGTDSDLFVSDLVAGSFGIPRVFPSLTTALHEDFPVVTPDQRTIYFARCATNVDLESCNMFVAHRDDPRQDFDNPTPVTELNTGGFDAPSWISADACTLYFVSSRDGSQDVFAVRR